jgi:hypothetical protein
MNWELGFCVGVPGALVIRYVSDFGEFFVSFVDESPENLAYWNVTV